MHKVLLVDDEPLILEHTQGLLPWETLNCRVVGTAANGIEGIEAIRRLRPDVVIMDVVMPGANGLEVIDAVAEEADCKFIIVSGYQEFDYVRHALRAGVVDYLLKPLTATELREALSRLLNESPKPQTDYEAAYGSIVAGVIRSIDEHFAEAGFSLGWLCENELFMDETYVSRLFRKRTNVKFTTWVTRRRMEEAERLLMAQRELSIEEIAERTGFSTSKYFIETFKKYAGLPPLQYRKHKDAARGDGQA